MSAGITPFGESFADPRRYMGQSPLAEVGKAAKTFLTGHALRQSGLENYLNSLGKKQPQGAAAPSAPATTAIQPPQANVAPVMPVVPQAPAAQGATPMNAPTGLEMPPDIGNQILDGTWTGFPPAPTGPTSLKNPTDFNPLAPDASNQMAVSPNDYKNAPGYGKLAKAVGMFMGMG